MKFRCIITHNVENTTCQQLCDLISYLWSYNVGPGIALGTTIGVKIVGKNVLPHREERVRIEKFLKLNKIEKVPEWIEDALILDGYSIISLDSDEVPLVALFVHLPEMMAEGKSVFVPLIHMRYRDTSRSIGGKEFKYKKFIDQKHTFFLDREEQIEIRLRSHYDYQMPGIPMSSKWVNWPTPKLVFRTKGNDATSSTRMYHAVYKFERVKEE